MGNKSTKENNRQKNQKKPKAKYDFEETKDTREDSRYLTRSLNHFPKRYRQSTTGGANKNLRKSSNCPSVSVLATIAYRESLRWFLIGVLLGP